MVKTIPILVIFSVIVVLTLFFYGGSASIALAPGFYLSAILTVHEHASYGTAYVVLGLTFNVLLLSTISVGVRHLLRTLGR